MGSWLIDRQTVSQTVCLEVISSAASSSTYDSEVDDIHFNYPIMGLSPCSCFKLPSESMVTSPGTETLSIRRTRKWRNIWRNSSPLSSNDSPLLLKAICRTTQIVQRGGKRLSKWEKPLPLSYSALFCNPICYYLGNIPRTLHALDVPEGAPTHGLLVTRGTRGCGE